MVEIDSNSLFSKRKAASADDIGPSESKSVPIWAKFATSQNNYWMAAIRLHDFGNYDDAWTNYLIDAVECRSGGYYGKAALSFALAAECLDKMGRVSLSKELLSEAKRCYDLQDQRSDNLSAVLSGGPRTKEQNPMPSSLGSNRNLGLQT
jgi:hypothetical protein